MPRKDAITPSGSGSVIEASPEAKLRGRPLRGNAEVRGDAEPGCRVAAVAAARLAGLAAGAAACSLPACEQKKNHATHLRSSEDIGTRERGLRHATEQLYASGAHRKRIAQAQAVTVGRARASDWSGSAATGREPPSDPWRGVVATGVARTGETRDAEVRRGAEAAGSREGPGPPDRIGKLLVDNVHVRGVYRKIGPL